MPSQALLYPGGICDLSEHFWRPSVNQEDHQYQFLSMLKAIEKVLHFSLQNQMFRVIYVMETGQPDEDKRGK
ncbi:hypothetical protein [Roseovarius tibetensis]|uniref:hypothetical protein n=1 Tax=Roseovarius tibetensis TaxID=2685897 RepID=UPI003D7F421A